jgi:tetratricopeptide (TPR) repeat protein
LRLGRRAIELYPERSTAWFALGWTARAAGQHDVAESALRKALDLKPDSSMWHNNLGVLLVDLGREEEALLEFVRAEELDPSNKYPLPNTIGALHALGRAKDVKKLKARYEKRRIGEAEEAVNTAPKDAVAVRNLARAMIGFGHHNEGVELARRAADLAPSPAAYLLVGDALDCAGDLEGARKAIERGLELDPTHAGLLASVAWRAAITRDAGAAADASARLHEAAEGERTRLAAAYAAHAAGRWEESLTLLEGEIRRRPRSCCAHVFRAFALLQLGRPVEARDAAARARIVNAWQCTSLQYLERELEAGSAS